MAEITLYNAVRDNGEIVAWNRIPLTDVHVESEKSAYVSGTKRSQATKTLLMIWLKDVETTGMQYVSPHEFDAVPVSGRGLMFTLREGDYIILGHSADMPEIGKPLREFIQTHDILQITAVEECLYGSQSMKHWEITAE